jgi:hypothetical protein
MKPARRVTIGCIAMAVAITAALAMASHRGARLKADTTYGAARDTPFTRESLTGSFDAGIRNVVVQWDPRDPRSPDARRAALMAFVYETYDASAWIPQSLFDSNFITQAVAGDIETIVSERAGLVQMARQSTRARRSAWRQCRLRSPVALDGELPDLSHGGDRRRGVLRRRHEDV